MHSNNNLILTIVFALIAIGAIFFIFKQAIDNLKKENKALLKREEDLIKNHESEKKNLEIQKSQIKQDIQENIEQNEYLKKQFEELERERKQLNKKIEKFEVEYQEKLQKISTMSRSQAKEEMLKSLEHYLAQERYEVLKEHNENLEVTKKHQAQAILISAMENIASEITTEVTQKMIELPFDDIKGKLIGRDGRNIRLLENTLGVNIIIDDTPNLISISSFNPIRREIARRTIENLVKNNRINQVTIEQETLKMEQEVYEETLEVGHQTVEDLGIYDLNLELVRLIGGLAYRTSYGQNILQHSIETAKIAKMIAVELGLDSQLALRAALLHDIGKIDPTESGRSHVEVGVRYAKKYGEDDIIINAIASHHGDIEPTSIYAIIVMIADSLSASKPGSRKQDLEMFIERMQQLEEVALQYEGVESCYALQGGKELRVVVNACEIDDKDMAILSHEIKKEIEENFNFPGVIKVNVIRELRVVTNAINQTNRKGLYV